MKIAIILLPLLLFLSCKELGNTIYEPPEIISLVLTHNDSLVTTVLPGDTVTAVVTATNPEKGILSYSWSVSPDSGRFLPPEDEDKAKWIAPLKGDIYTIKVIVSNDKKNDISKDIEVLSLDKPYVRINSPSNNQYFVQGQEITIKVTAYHDNGLNKLWLLVDSVKVDSLDGKKSSDSYQFIYKAGYSKSGPVELKVVAEANTGSIGSDYIIISIEGILPKEGNP